MLLMEFDCICSNFCNIRSFHSNYCLMWYSHHFCCCPLVAQTPYSPFRLLSDVDARVYPGHIPPFRDALIPLPIHCKWALVKEVRILIVYLY